MKKIFSTLFALAMLFGAAIATAAETIRIVLPYPSGGLMDRAVRETQKVLNENSNYKFIIEPRTGAGGRIAATHVAQSNGKETVLISASGPAFIIGAQDKNSMYRMADFVPVAYIGSAPFVMVTNKNNPVNTVEKLLVTDNQTPLFFTSSGYQTGTWLAGAALKIATDKNLIHVPMHGEAQGLQEVLANRVSFAFVSASTIKGHEDKLTIVAAAQSTRIKRFPDVPTFKEKGIAGIDHGPVWVGLYANSTADPALIKEIQTVLARELAKPEIRAVFEQLGVVVTVDSILKLNEISRIEETRIQQVLAKTGVE